MLSFEKERENNQKQTAELFSQYYYKLSAISISPIWFCILFEGR